MKKIIFVSFLCAFSLANCKKEVKNSSRYMETLSYDDGGSLYQRDWYMYDNKKIDAVTGIHTEEDASKITGKRSYWMTLAYNPKTKDKVIAASIYDNETGMLNGKFTLKRLYSYDGESYIHKAQLNFKGTFQETIVYYDTAGVQPNDTTVRTGTFVMEYTGMNKGGQ